MEGDRHHSPTGRRFHAVAAAAALILSGVAAGQALAPVHPTLTLHRTDDPPVIDGVLADPVWTAAALIDDLRQVEPVENAEPTERTEIRIAYDRDFLYFGIRCYDRDPGAIIAKQLARDGDLDSDDRIELVIDPFFDRRNGYLFAINPVGARLDALVVRNRRVREEWDGIWYGKSTIDDGGWSAEIAIPFKTISFNPATTRWSFNIERTIRRRNETNRWSSPRQNTRLRSIADAGVLEGIGDITQGLGLDVKPYSKITHRDDDDAGSDTEFDAGLDVFYKITPSMTLALTINTDFAEIEVDERRVNLTRFPLFFPEKRDFFLQDAGIFDFGGIRMNPLPFQSRKIGLGADGRPIDILVGVKLTGREGPLNLGLLSVQTDSSAGVGEKNLTVARAAFNVLAESTVGVIGTVGDPRTPGDNHVLGTDFNYRDSRIFGNRTVEGHAWFLHSSSTGADGDDQAWGLKLSYPNDRIDWTFAVTEIGERFDAALGFVPRRGIREYFGVWRYRWRPRGSFVRTIDSGVRGLLVTDLDGQTETRELEFELLEVRSNDGDELSFDVELNREVLDEPFEISPGIMIPTGDHRFNRLGGSVRTSDGRPVSFFASAEGGEFFDGDRLDFEVGAELRPSPHFFFAFSWEHNDVKLPAGDFTLQIAQARVNVLLSPNVAWTNFIQWDSASDSLGINSRLRWIIEPGNELFFVVNQAINTEGNRFDSTATEVTTKVGWTFRF